MQRWKGFAAKVTGYILNHMHYESITQEAEPLAIVAIIFIAKISTTMLLF